MATVTKPMALDETLQATNEILNDIKDALANSSIVGDTDISAIADGTLTGAVAEFDGDIAGINTTLEGLGDAATKDVANTYDAESTDPISGQGVAEALETTEVESLSDTTPYLYRKSPAIGTRVMENALVGASVVVNQLVDSNTTSVTIASGHKYIAKINSVWSVGTSDGTAISVDGSRGDKFVDLTQYFGSNTIPTYVISLGATNALAYLQSYGFLTGSLPYNTGTLESVNPTAKKVVGKNLLPMTVEGIKAGKTSGTWSGNAYTINNVTFTILTDDGENVTGIKVNGTASGNVGFTLCSKSAVDFLTDGTSYIVNGCPSGGSESTFYLVVSDNITQSYFDTGNGESFTPSSTFVGNDYFCRIYITSGTQISNKVFYPMIRFSTVTDSTFVPYEEHTYPISQSPLRGLFTLVNDSIKASGDRRKSDGTHSVKYGIVDLGSLNWNHNTSSTYGYWATTLTGVKQGTLNLLHAIYRSVNAASLNGSEAYANTMAVMPNNATILVNDKSDSVAPTGHLVYELATSTTEQLAPFDNPQISIVGGTEEWLTDNDVPVGHQSEYKKLPPMFEDDYIQTIQERAERSVFTHDSLVGYYTDSGGVLAYTDDYVQITFNLDKTYSYTPLVPLKNYSADYTDCTMIAQGIDVSLYNANDDDISGKALPVLMECTDLGDKMRVVIGLYNLRLDATTGDVTAVDILVHFAIFGATNRVLVQ